MAVTDAAPVVVTEPTAPLDGAPVTVTVESPDTVTELICPVAETPVTETLTASLPLSASGADASGEKPSIRSRHARLLMQRR